MPSYIFQNILKKGAKLGISPSTEQASADWYRNQAKWILNPSPTKMLKSDATRLVKVPLLGRMYLYAYDPKTKDKLPYYDTFPLVIPFDAVRTGGRAGNSQGFMGLNLHYLPLRERAFLMNGLYKYVDDPTLSEQARIKVSYRFLKRVSSLRFYKPCVKQYLVSHMRSPFFRIDPQEWDMALFLNLARWQKASQSTVWKDSRSMI